LSGKTPDIYRLYLVNMEQQIVLKRALAFAFFIIGLANLVFVLVSGGQMQALGFMVLVFFAIYFLFGELIAGVIASREPEKIAEWAAKQKLLLKDETDAGELVVYAAKKLRNGNIKECREALQKFFKLKYVASSTVRFAYLVLADAQRQEGDLDKSLNTLRQQVTKDEVDSLSLFVLGRTFLQQEKYNKASEVLERAWEHYLSKNYGIPDLLRSKLRNRELKIVYSRTLEVFIPYYLAKAYWGLGNVRKARDFLNSALVLCRNKNLRPYLEESFSQ